MLSRDPARSRPPVDRPLDVVGLELLVCVTQALLAGLLLTLAGDLGGDARAVGLPVPGLLAVLGLAIGAAWIWWLAGGSGWLLAALNLAVALLTGALWLLSIQDTGAPRIDPLVGLIALGCAVYGIVAGVFLPGPRRTHWKGGTSQPRRGLSDQRATPARFSPPVQKVVDERLANISLARVSESAIRLRSVRLPSRATPATDSVGDHPGSLTAVAPVATETDGGAVATTVATPPATPANVIVAAAPVTADTEVSSLIHRILTGDEPLSVSAMRLSGIPPATDDIAIPDPDDADDDETLPFPAAASSRPAGDAAGTGPRAGDAGHDDLDDGQLDPATGGTTRGT